MTATYYPVSDNCIIVDKSATEFCFDVIDCNPTCTEYFIKECDNLYNCNKKQSDKNYCTLIPEDGKVQFQLQFIDEWNPDPTQPEEGWGIYIRAQVCDIDGNNLGFTGVSNLLVGWNGEYSYQLIEFDPGLMPDCWSVTFTRHIPGQIEAVEEVCTEPFKKQQGCEGLMKIESKYPGEDCCGNYYGLPEDDMDAYDGSALFQYSNTTYVPGFIRCIGPSVTKNRFGNKVTNSTVTDIYELNIACVPKYKMEWITKILLAGERVCIDDVDYQFDNYAVSNIIDHGTNFSFTVTGTKECEVKFNCR